MASSSAAALEIIDDDDEFDWYAAVREIDLACEANGVALPVNGTFASSPDGVATSTSTSIPNRKTLKTPNGGVAFRLGSSRFLICLWDFCLRLRMPKPNPTIQTALESEKRSLVMRGMTGFASFHLI
ncbi:unnamed protein product [Cuscuta campestris]|uniref:Uncharacterized protein n=1 Tax=Cuscuta campestris TaxID=132261 RepID=A0A484N4B3_9ASTE|nr:unnamed protein product [Cuscuta campestris]